MSSISSVTEPPLGELMKLDKTQNLRHSDKVTTYRGTGLIVFHVFGSPPKEFHMASHAGVCADIKSYAHSYAGITRIRFEGPDGDTSHLQPACTSAPWIVAPSYHAERCLSIASFHKKGSIPPNAPRLSYSPAFSGAVKPFSNAVRPSSIRRKLLISGWRSDLLCLL